LINFAFCAIPPIYVLILSLVGERVAPKALKLETLHELVLAAEIRRVANMTERDVIAAVVAVVRPEGRERSKTETPARLLKRQTPSTGAHPSTTGNRARGVLVHTCRSVSLSEF
jgi:hypothetical protein